MNEATLPLRYPTKLIIKTIEKISYKKALIFSKKHVIASEQSDRGNLKEKRYLQADCHVSPSSQ